MQGVYEQQEGFWRILSAIFTHLEKKHKLKVLSKYVFDAT